MGFLDKIKDLFMDEVEEGEEIEIEEEKQPEKTKDTLPKIMRENIRENDSLDFTSKFNLGEEPKKERKEENNDKFKTFNDEIKKERVVKETRSEIPKQVVVQQREESVKKFSFPVDFQDDYVPRRNNNVNVLNTLEEKKTEPKRTTPELYSKKNTEKPKFKASPVISPVYGILDKNYKKEEVKEREEAERSMKRPSKIVDFETVRKKAFGNLSDDIKDNLLCENCELYKEVKRISSLKEDDLLYDLTQEPTETKEVTLEKAYDNYEEFGVAYEHKKVEEVEVKEVEDVDVDDIIVDHTNETKAEEIKFKEPEEDIDNDISLDDVIKNVNTEENIKEEVKIPSREDKKKDTKVDADFFDLIDSMYKERVDE